MRKKGAVRKASLKQRLLRRIKRRKFTLPLVALFGSAVALLSIAISMVLWSSVAVLLDRPVDQIAVVGELRNLNSQQFIRNVEVEMEKGYFRLDLQKIKRDAEELDWIDTVQVERRWPDSLRLTVREHIAVARWGENALLSDKGKVFSPENIEAFTQLPQLYAVSAPVDVVVHAYTSISERLAVFNLNVVSLRRSPRESWVVEVETTNEERRGFEIVMGRGSVDGKIDRFLKIYTRALQAERHRLQVVDMRYSNGVAVQWRTPGKDNEHITAHENFNRRGDVI